VGRELVEETVETDDWDEKIAPEKPDSEIMSQICNEIDILKFWV
jgi:hypothetical protein